MRALRNIDVRLHATISTVLSVLFCFWAYVVRTDQFFSPLLTNIGTTFLGLAVGLFVLNIYLHTRSQQDAVAAVLLWVYPSFRDRHNRFRQDTWNAVGIDISTQLLQSFATKLSENQRSVVAKIACDSQTNYKKAFLELDQTLTDLERLFGWTFDKDILSSIFHSRCAIRELQYIEFTDQSRSVDICESFLRADIHCTNVIQGLLGILGYEIDNANLLPHNPPMNEKRLKTPYGSWR